MFLKQVTPLSNWLILHATRVLKFLIVLTQKDQLDRSNCQMHTTCLSQYWNITYRLFHWQQLRGCSRLCGRFGRLLLLRYARCLPYAMYAAEYSMSFIAQKSKRLVILSNACRYLKPLLQDNVFYVDGKRIDVVSSFPHLGHVITDTLDDGLTLRKRLGNFIGQINDVCASLVRCPVTSRHACLEVWLVWFE